MKGLLLLAALSAAPLAAEAREIPAVKRFMIDEITKQSTVQVTNPVVPHAAQDYVSTYWYPYDLSLFRLRLQAEVGFDVWLGRVTAVPMVEFFFE